MSFTTGQVPRIELTPPPNEVVIDGGRQHTTPSTIVPIGLTSSESPYNQRKNENVHLNRNLSHVDVLSLLRCKLDGLEERTGSQIGVATRQIRRCLDLGVEILKKAIDLYQQEFQSRLLKTPAYGRLAPALLALHAAELALRLSQRESQHRQRLVWLQMKIYRLVNREVEALLATIEACFPRSQARQQSPLFPPVSDSSYRMLGKVFDIEMVFESGFLPSNFPPMSNLVRDTLAKLNDSKLLGEMPTSPSTPNAAVMGVEDILNIEDPVTAAYVLWRSVSRGRVTWNDIVQLHDRDVVRMMDILDRVVSMEKRRGKLASQCSSWIIRLHRRNGQLPSSIFLSDVSPPTSAYSMGGAYGDVYEGEWRGKKVALKVSRVAADYSIDQMAAARQKFYSEAVFWRQLHHRNVLLLHGIYINEVRFPNRLSIISPWMKHGNILKFIQKNPTCDRRKLLRQAASGIQYLHNMVVPLVHGDIKGANILIKDDGEACLCDFGLLQFAEASPSMISPTLNTGGGTMRWSAPELLIRGELRTAASDIYAFGLTILEVYTETIPFHWIRGDGFLMFHAINGTLLPIDRGRFETVPILKEIWDIIDRCCEADAKGRSSAKQVVSALR